jgi:thiol-disulfide isomerase/thioredoxin
MNKKLGRTHIWLITLVSVVLGALVLVMPACKKDSKPPAAQNPQPGTANMKDRLAQSANQAIQTGKEAPIRLSDIVSSEKSWNPTLEAFAGKPAPDFTVKDITGKDQKLSDLRGKNVMVVIWAPWCGPCRMEIPDLVELRKTIAQDQLAILAVSYISPENTEEMVRQFVQQSTQQGVAINYTVAVVNKDAMPAPFSSAEYIPSTFWIAPDGTIKITTVGAVPLADMKAILKASAVKTPTKS